MIRNVFDVLLLLIMLQCSVVNMLYGLAYFGLTLCRACIVGVIYEAWFWGVNIFSVDILATIYGTLSDQQFSCCGY